MRPTFANRPNVLVYAFGVMALFCSINFLQRWMLGASPMAFAGYIFPAIVGAFSGTLIARALIRVHDLNIALDARIAHLEKLLPICAACKSIRRPDMDTDDPASWMRIEQYLHEEAGQLLTHGLCPGCAKEMEVRSEHRSHG